MSIQKSKILKIFLFLVFITNYQLPITSYQLFAQDTNKLIELSRQIIEAKTKEEMSGPLEELKDLYFHQNKYTEMVEFLDSLGQKKEGIEDFINYYIALSRYQQLKYLEENQKWEEYFGQGPAYKEQLSGALEKVINSTSPKEPLYLYSRLLYWQFHYQQQDIFSEGALADLWNAALEYAKDSSDIQPLREVADRLLSYEFRQKAKQLYRIYVERLSGSKITDEGLKEIALDFYKETNLELAEAVSDVYVLRISENLPKEELIPALVEIVRVFLDSDHFYPTSRKASPFIPPLHARTEFIPQQIDAGFRTRSGVYAEKIFKKIEEVGTKEALTEELTFLRGLNLERLKEYSGARDIYLDFQQRFASSTLVEAVNFRIALISTYILRDLAGGRSYFEKIAGQERVSPQVISSFYHLGLLSQWEENLAKAKEYYNTLLEKAKDGFRESVALTQQRLKELNEERPLDYNLKMFLDISLKEEYAYFEMNRVELRPSVYNAKKEQEINITSAVFAEPSGCMQVEMQYLWSGNTGKTKPSVSLSGFNTSYTDAGIKEINLVVVSPSGVVDRSMEMIEVE